MNSSISTLNRAGIERVHYFSRQMLTADDMLAEQEYFRQKLRRHNRFLHGWGVVCGCEVLAAPTSTQPWRIQVCPGYVVTPQGDEIELVRAAYFDLATVGTELFDPCKGSSVVIYPDSEAFVHLAICYSECSTRPTRIHPAGCGCDEAGCEYTRIRDDFMLTVLDAVPKSHTDASTADMEWRSTIGRWLKEGRENAPPVPPCPGCPAECWVVLASMTLPAKRAENLKFGQGGNSTFSYNERRVLYSTTALHQMSLP